MQDLDVIIRNNAKAVEEHVLKTRNTGKWGVAKYVGLNFYDYEDFDTEAERNAAAIAWNNEPPGNRSALHDPIVNR